MDCQLVHHAWYKTLTLPNEKFGLRMEDLATVSALFERNLTFRAESGTLLSNNSQLFGQWKNSQVDSEVGLAEHILQPGILYRTSH